MIFVVMLICQYTYPTQFSSHAVAADTTRHAQSTEWFDISPLAPLALASTRGGKATNTMPEQNNGSDAPVVSLDKEAQRKLQEISQRLDELAKNYTIHQETVLTKSALALSEKKTNLQIGDINDKIKEMSASLDRFADLNTRFGDIEKRLLGLKAKKARTPARSLRHLATAVSVATIFATLIAAWSGYETRRSANEARKAADVQIWFYLSSQYSSRETFAAMKKLRAYQVHNPKTFAADFKTGLINIDKLSNQERQKIEDIDAARRHISYFCGTLIVLSNQSELC